MNSQWTMQKPLYITHSSTRTLPYWADASDSSICLSKHSSSYPGTSSYEKAYTSYNLKNIGLICVVHQLRKIQPPCPFWSIKKEEKNKDRASVPYNLWWQDYWGKGSAPCALNTLAMLCLKRDSSLGTCSLKVIEIGCVVFDSNNFKETHS